MSAWTRVDLARAVAKDLGIHPRAASGMVNAVIAAIQSGLLTRGRVVLRNFAVLEVRVRKSRIGRNPLKPDEADILIPARRVVKFKAGRVFDAKLNPDL